MWLITFPVIAVQLFIYFSIRRAAKNGWGYMLLVAGGWSIFTLGGAVFTAGLMLLQMITIIYATSRGVGNANTQPRQMNNKGGYFWLIGFLFLGYLAYLFIFDKNKTAIIKEPIASPPTTQYFYQETPQQPLNSSFPRRWEPGEIDKMDTRMREYEIVFDVSKEEKMVRSQPPSALDPQQSKEKSNTKSNATNRQGHKSDLRHCLDLPSREEIIKCTNK